jgi:hypothetical protein
VLHKLVHPHRLYTLFKYTVYLLLIYNVWLFFVEEWNAAQITARSGLTLDNIISSFAATIDTAAWVLLLLLFELETWILPDRVLKRSRALRWSLQALTALCYTVIAYAFYGYLTKTFFYLDVDPMSIADACALVGQGWSYLVTLDEFAPLDAGSCLAFAGEPLYRLPGEPVLMSAQSLLAAQRLAWVDVINSGTWLLVVALLQVDVILQLRGALEGTVLQLSRVAKAVAYTVLVLAAVYWGVFGDFLDFWDAMLWLVAFAFIEMNLFRWNLETRREDGP